MATPNQPGSPSDEPPWGAQPPGYQPPRNPQIPPPPGYPPPAGYPPYPGYPGNAFNPYAPFGHDAATGLPLSDKSATTAGLLQLFFGVFGAGRFYIDSTQIAVAQLCVGLFGFVFSVFCFFGLPVLLGSLVWAVVDAIMMFTGGVKDNHGRKLR